MSRERRPECLLSEEEGTVVCEQGGQRGDPRRVTLNQRPGGGKRSSHSEIDQGSCQPGQGREGCIREDPGSGLSSSRPEPVSCGEQGPVEVDRPVQGTCQVSS